MTRRVCLASVDPDEAGRLCGSLVCPVPARNNAQMSVSISITDRANRWRIDASLMVSEPAMNKRKGQ